MKKSFGMFTLLASILLAFPAWAIEAPDTLVDKTVREVIEIIGHDDDYKSGNKEKILDLVEEKILPHFNFTRMTQLAMGKNWRKAAPEQQTELVEEFRTLLVRTYSNALSSYQNEVIKVDPLPGLKDEEVDATVKTKVIQGMGKEPVPIDYSMEKKADGWKVYDVTVAGVSLITNYRGSFNSQIRKGGVEGLLKTLAEKNRSLEGK